MEYLSPKGVQFTERNVGKDPKAREELMARYGGMSSMQAIIASTRVAAELLHLDGQTGALAAGKLADLLVVEGDPLADLSILAQPDRLALIVKSGAAARDRLSPQRS